MILPFLVLLSPSACVDRAPTSPDATPYAMVADSVIADPADVIPLDSVRTDSLSPIAAADDSVSVAPGGSTFATQRFEEQRSKGGVALPRVFLDFPFPSVTGRSIRVGAGDNLQSALNRARRGDEVVLAAGARFVGNFELPALAGSAADGWVVVRSEQADRLPPLGTRVSPQDGALMPAIITPNTGPALRLEAGASGWRLVGLEVSVTSSVTQQQYGLIFLGDNERSQSTLASVPTDIVLDRMYIHALPTTNTSRCVALNSARTQISDSYITECHGKGFDSQAIWGGNGPGPYKIVNNYLAGAGENIMFGGSDPHIPGLVPADIEIRRNYIHTPLAWKGVWERKNLLELKNATRVLIEGNVMDGSWPDGQSGWAVILKSENQSGRCRWCRTTDVTMQRNLIVHAGSGINVTGRGHNPVDTTARRIVIRETVLDSLGYGPYGSGSDRRGIMILAGAASITFDQTLITGSQLAAVFWVEGGAPLSIRNNVWVPGQYGVMGSGVPGAIAALNRFAPGTEWTNNTILSSPDPGMPPGTKFAASELSTPAASIRAKVRLATAGVVR